jgi:transposase
MAKYTSDEKLSAVQRYLSNSESYAAIALSIGAVKSEVMNWVKQFEHNALEAFNKSYTSYPVEFKLEVLNYMVTHGTSPNETAARFNIPSPRTIRTWRMHFESRGIDALNPKKKGRPSMKEVKKATPVEGSTEALQAEIERLRMENAYLKKLNALVQSKEESRHKTKRK